MNTIFTIKKITGKIFKKINTPLKSNLTEISNEQNYNSFNTEPNPKLVNSIAEDNSKKSDQAVVDIEHELKYLPSISLRTKVFFILGLLIWLFVANIKTTYLSDIAFYTNIVFVPLTTYSIFAKYKLNKFISENVILISLSIFWTFAFVIPSITKIEINKFQINTEILNFNNLILFLIFISPYIISYFSIKKLISYKKFLNNQKNKLT